MLLHLGLMLVVAPLLAMGLAQRLPTPTSFRDAMGWYLLAGAFEALVVLGWHIPLLHDAAGHAPLLFVVEQLSFLAAGLALWICIFTARVAGAAIAGALVAALTFSHMSMFGLLLALAPRLLYDPDLCQGWLGADRVDDQHLGGALMAAGGLVYLLAAVVLFARAAAAVMEPSR
jgi:putative membrane protein